MTTNAIKPQKRPLRYTPVKKGEWIQPVRRNYKMVCCDCGLVHTLNFRIRSGRAQFNAYRDVANTKRYRRQQRIKVRT